MARPFTSASRMMVEACRKAPRTIKELAALTQSSVRATHDRMRQLLLSGQIRSIRTLKKRPDGCRSVYAVGDVLPPKPRLTERKKRLLESKRLTQEQLEALNKAFHTDRPPAPGRCQVRTVRGLVSQFDPEDPRVKCLT